MKTKLILGLALVLSGGCTSAPPHDSAGANEPCDPYHGVILSRGVLYGTTSGNPVVFKVNTDGTGFAILHRFSPFKSPLYTNSDGAGPGGLTVSGDTLYGTASGGGSTACGTIFSVRTNGRDFAVLHSFNGNDGAEPWGDLVLSGRTLYGTTLGRRGIIGDSGTVFKVNTDGTGFTTLHAFAALRPADDVNWTNGDGRGPMSALVLSGNTLWGSTFDGGPGGSGTLFRINTDGTGFVVLHAFARGATSQNPRWFTNSDGAFSSSLLLHHNALYGMTSCGGTNGLGTLFKVSTEGSDFTLLFTFPPDSNGGASPEPLVSVGGSLYGIPSNDLNRDWRAIFKINPDGTGFTKLSIFPNDASMGPVIGLTPSGDGFYGTTEFGGKMGGGIVFKVNAKGTGLKVIHCFTEEWRLHPPNGGMTD